MMGFIKTVRGTRPHSRRREKHSHITLNTIFFPVDFTLKVPALNEGHIRWLRKWEGKTKCRLDQISTKPKESDIVYINGEH